MTTQRSDQEVIDLCKRCAEQCTLNAEKCREEGLYECARLSMECASACYKAIQDGHIEVTLFQDCADACKACATECEAHEHQHCVECAILCRECEEACYNAVD